MNAHLQEEAEQLHRQEIAWAHEKSQLKAGLAAALEQKSASEAELAGVKGLLNVCQHEVRCPICALLNILHQVLHPCCDSCSRSSSALTADVAHPWKSLCTPSLCTRAMDNNLAQGAAGHMNLSRTS